MLLIPISIVITVLQGLVLGGFGLIGVSQDSEAAGAMVLLAVAIGTAFTILGLALVQAATACALVDIDEGRPTGPVDAYRDGARADPPAARRGRDRRGRLGAAHLDGVPDPGRRLARGALGARRAGRRARRPPRRDAVRRSARLVRGHWWRVASIVGVGAGLAIVAGPFVGALMILLTDAPLALLNLVAGVVYALAMPFVALATSYVYFDLRTRHELASTSGPTCFRPRSSSRAEGASGPARSHSLRGLSRPGWLDASELRIGLGCMRLSTDEDRDEARAYATIAAAAEAGVTVFDTARSYGHGADELGTTSGCWRRRCAGAGPRAGRGS